MGKFINFGDSSKFSVNKIINPNLTIYNRLFWLDNPTAKFIFSNNYKYSSIHLNENNVSYSNESAIFDGTASMYCDNFLDESIYSTILLRVKFYNLDKNQSVFKSGGYANGFEVGIKNGEFGFYCQNSDNLEQTTISTSDLKTNVWYYVYIDKNTFVVYEENTSNIIIKDNIASSTDGGDQFTIGGLDTDFVADQLQSPMMDETYDSSTGKYLMFEGEISNIFIFDNNTAKFKFIDEYFVDKWYAVSTLYLFPKYNFTTGQFDFNFKGSYEQRIENPVEFKNYILSFENDTETNVEILVTSENNTVLTTIYSSTFTPGLQKIIFNVPELNFYQNDYLSIRFSNKVKNPQISKTYVKYTERPTQIEELLCKRYFQKNSTITNYSDLPIKMRVNPIIANDTFDAEIY